MKRITVLSRRTLSMLIAAPFIVLACTTAATDTGDADTAALAATPAAVAEAPAETASAPTDDILDEPAAEPTWLDIELTDSASGEPFTLASLKGEVVALEPMAIWCSNCKAQQDNVKQIYDDIEASGVRYISLGIDPFEDPDALAKYADQRGYGWTFAQAPPEFARAMSELFGPQILSAPSTPLIVLDDTGELFRQEFGFHGPEKLQEILAEASA